MPELKPGTRVWRRAKQQRAVAVHRSDRPEHLQGTELDRLCEGLPNSKLHKELLGKASPIIKNESYNKPAHVPIFAQFYRVRCRNCGETQKQFSHLFIREQRGNVIAEITYREAIDRLPDKSYLSNMIADFCPMCLPDMEVR